MRYVKEAELENKIVNWALGRGFETLKLNVQGRRGYPDRLFFLPQGKLVMVEFKAEGEALRPLQAYVRSKLMRLGHAVEVHDNFEECIAAFKKRLGE